MFARTKKLLLYLSFLVFIAIAFAKHSLAATHTMSACTRDAFITAYTAATTGDTIVFPAGTCDAVWNSEISITKSLTIRGQGSAYTSIAAPRTVFSLADPAANGTRITGIRFNNCGPCIYTRGVKNIRIDHNVHVAGTTNDPFFQAYGETVAGVADHNELVNSYGFYMGFLLDSSQTYPFAVGNALDPEAVFFIEDNTFVVTDVGCPSHQVVGNFSTRLVIRNNSFDYSAATACGWLGVIDAHDSYENWPHRGTLGYEIYNNTFTVRQNHEMLLNLRGGEHIVYNNYTNANLSYAWRIQSYNGNAGMHCSGNVWDTEDLSPSSCMDQINHSYFWNNKVNCGNDVITCSGGMNQAPTNDTPTKVLLNTHYFVSEKSGYTPFPYPHPFVLNQAAPSPDTQSPAAPTGLSVQ